MIQSHLVFFACLSGDASLLSYTCISMILLDHWRSDTCSQGCTNKLSSFFCSHGAGRGGQYFSPPYLSVLTFHINNAGRFYPYHKSSRNEEHWKRLYDKTLDIVNNKLKEKNLPVISAV